VGTKQVFFGDFLSPDKKLPAGRRTAEAVTSTNTKIKGKELDSGFRRNDERWSKSWIPPSAGMTSVGAKAGFRLPPE
jgi:hypothetical protein